MKPTLVFEKRIMKRADLGSPATVPDLIGDSVFQNNMEYCLGEDDEIFEAYGRKSNSYPYTQFNGYSRELKEQETLTAVLENDALKAVFLPEVGGRLWELWDKKTGKNLLYTNDVLRYSNLAIRNAWFSGGVEWNIGIIGHTPFTTERMNTCTLEDEKGNPVLRMYAYERVRNVEYQMDFWLEEEQSFLNARIRVLNSSRDVVPMYWWSNMAVPEHKNGRLVVPADEAFKGTGAKVEKVAIPMVDGVDISYYQDIPRQIDFFFHIMDEEPKYIINTDEDGYGLFHLSTKRLRARKLFSWGHNQGSEKWQRFLTEDAGDYIEIQAGVGKTQYGCLPMAPNTAWEWLEQYGPIVVEKEVRELPYEELREKMTSYAKKAQEDRKIEQVLKETKALAKKPGEMYCYGESYGALEVIRREHLKERPLSDHLDYGTTDRSEDIWVEFLKTGVMPEREVEAIPDRYQCQDSYMKLLLAKQEENKDNWTYHYHLGLFYYYKEEWEKCVEEMQASLNCKESAWAYHGLASVLFTMDQKEQAVEAILKGIKMRDYDVSYVKDGFRILLLSEVYDRIVEIFPLLPENTASNSRIYFGYMMAMTYTGSGKEVYKFLQDHPTFVVDDIRECEESIGTLYERAYEAQFGEKPESIPKEWDFKAL